MKNNWKKCKLSDIVDINMGQSPKSEFYNTEKKGFPFLQGNRTFGYKYPTYDTYTTNPTKIAKTGDIIMSVRAPVGDINVISNNICIGRGLCALRMKNNNQDYLYYLIKYYSKYLINKESGTVFGSINRNDIASLEVVIPQDYTTQRQIAKILSSLDDKIELNNRINKNLEEQAMAIFDEYFSNISNGKNNIGNYLSPKRGKNLLSKDAINGDVPVVAGGLLPSVYHNTANTKSPVITISASGANAGYVHLWHIPVWSSDSSFIDTDITQYIYFWYVLLKKRQKEIFDSQTGSAQPHVYPQHIENMSLVELNFKVVEKYNRIVSPLFSYIGKTLKENTILINFRDTLLPKLMNGAIDVSKLIISISK